MTRVALWLAGVSTILAVGGCGSSTPPQAAAPASPEYGSSYAPPSSGSGGGEQAASSSPAEPESTASSGGYQPQYPNGANGQRPTAMNAESSSEAVASGYGSEYMAAQAAQGYGSSQPGYGTGYGSESGFPGNGMPGARPPAPKKATLKDRSIVAFQSGNTRRSHILLGAYALQAADEEATEIVSNYRLANHRVSKRPLVGLNVAIGATIKNPRNIADLSPIGSDSNNSGSMGSMEGMVGQGSSSSGSAANAKKSYAEVTGALGKRLAQVFTEKHSDGLWAPYYQEYTLGRARQGQMNGSQEYGSDFGSSQYGASPYGSSSPYGNSAGASAGVGEAPFFQRPDQFGGESFPGFQGSNQPPVVGMVPADSILPSGYTAVAPGLTYIGADEKNKLIKKAAQEGFDCLIYFEIEIRPGPKTVNETRISVLLPREATKDVKSLGATKELNNVHAAKAKEKGGSDGVDEAIDSVIKRIQDNLTLSPLPADTAFFDYVTKQRIPDLVNNKDEDLSTMERLIEVNFYYLKGFIDENERATAFESIAQTNGQLIATGKSSEKTKAIEKILEKEFK